MTQDQKDKEGTKNENQDERKGRIELRQNRVLINSRPVLLRSDDDSLSCISKRGGQRNLMDCTPRSSLANREIQLRLEG